MIKLILEIAIIMIVDSLKIDSTKIDSVNNEQLVKIYSQQTKIDSLLLNIKEDIKFIRSKKMGKKNE